MSGRPIVEPTPPGVRLDGIPAGTTKVDPHGFRDESEVLRQLGTKLTPTVVTMSRMPAVQVPTH